MSTNSDDDLSLRHFQRETRRRCMITATSITVDELHKQGHRPLCQHCNCGNSTVFCTVITQTPVVVQQRASQPCPRTPLVGSRRSSAQFALWEHVSVAQQECPTTVEELNLGHLHVLARHGLQELVADDHRDVHNRREEPARPTHLKKFRRRRPAARRHPTHHPVIAQVARTYRPPEISIVSPREHQEDELDDADFEALATRPGRM